MNDYYTPPGTISAKQKIDWIKVSVWFALINFCLITWYTFHTICDAILRWLLP